MKSPNRFFLCIMFACCSLLYGCNGGGGDSQSDTGGSGSSGSGSITGLDFPDNDTITNGDTVRFQFTSPLNPYPATYIWRIYPRQQPGYYTTFFWGNNGEFLPGDVYYGFHPYPDPPPDGTNHKWEISVNGVDTQSPQNVVYDTWYTQVARVYVSGTDRILEFYWDWPDTTSHVITQTVAIAEQPGLPPNPVLTFGDAPWAQGNEMLSGILRGIQIYDSLLSENEISAEIADPGSARNPWYLNLNPTPTDISDKSGNGHSPVWVGSLRPTLYQN
ncbi:MAG: hypothetical protein JXA04_00500 [Gammaproteobacteria bacterium]|nr:hypothetical protein [Gammaproteobacteria bacterium]